VGDSYAYAPWFMRLGIRLTNLKISFADPNAQEALLRQSDIDWIKARPVGLNNKEDLKKLNTEIKKNQHLSASAVSKWHIFLSTRYKAMNSCVSHLFYQKANSYIQLRFVS